MQWLYSAKPWRVRWRLLKFNLRKKCCWRYHPADFLRGYGGLLVACFLATLAMVSFLTTLKLDFSFIIFVLSPFTVLLCDFFFKRFHKRQEKKCAQDDCDCECHEIPTKFCGCQCHYWCDVRMEAKMIEISSYANANFDLSKVCNCYCHRWHSDLL